jgi:Lar family restriction alleviation protein
MNNATLIELATIWELQADTGGDGLNDLQPPARETLRACADTLRMMVDAAPQPEPQAQAGGETVKPCPFCGASAKLTSRPDNSECTEFIGIVSCFCGGYSACAHKMAMRATQEEANAAVIEAWNTRALAGQAVAHRPVAEPLSDDLLLRSVEIALANMVSYQSTSNTPTIHEFGHARRTLDRVRALLSKQNGSST